MPESARSKLMRWGFNLLPAFRGTGAWITYIADDYCEVRIELPMSWRTRNYVGTMFGGSIYAATDGVYMIMLMKNLGRDYIVWDKAASLRFVKPARTRLYSRFVLTQSELDDIRTTLAPGAATERTYRVDLAARDGTVHAEVVTSTSAGVRPHPIADSTATLVRARSSLHCDDAVIRVSSRVAYRRRRRG